MSANPYRGLASFTYENRAFYGGRDQQIGEAIALLTADGEQPVVVFVTGASGSGKSSFVQAGILPALEAHYQGTTVKWAVARPGRHPLLAIGRALGTLDVSEQNWSELAPAPSGQVNVLVLDQFEELFTQAEAAEREQVCRWLAEPKSFAQIRTHVLVTLRADYLPSIFDVPTLFEQFKRHGIELRAMTPSELARAIRQPLLEQARRDGTPRSWQPALVERLVEDVGTEATLLPLLQVTLTALWDEPPHRLVLERYRTLTDALEQQAERAYAADRLGKPRSDDTRAELMSIFLDLVEVSLDDDPHRDVRRTVPKRDLLAGQPERAPLIDELVDARLLATSLDQQPDHAIELVDIIHETLLRNWARLREAIQQARDVLQSGERFRLALHEWLDHERSDDYLLEGVRLAEAQQLANQRHIAFADPSANELLERSTVKQEEERQRELAQAHALAAEQQARAEDSARSASRLRRWLVATAVAGLAALVAAGVATVAFVQADQQARISKSLQFAAVSSAQLETDPRAAIAVAQMALDAWGTREAEQALRIALASSTVRVVVHQPLAFITVASLSPDGRHILTGASNGAVRVTNASTGQTEVELAGAQAPIRSASFSPDGQRILIFSADGTASLGSATGTQLGVLPVQGLTAGAWSPDSRFLALARSDGQLRIIDARTGEMQRAWPAHALRITGLSFSPDGKKLLSGGFDPVARIWDVETGQLVTELRGHTERISSIGFDRDGGRVVTASADGTAAIWDAATGSLVHLLEGHTGPLGSVAFSPDGLLVLTASMDQTARLWDAGTGRERNVLRGHDGPVQMAAFSADGRQVVTASFDHTARMWDTQLGTLLLTLRGHTKEVTSAQFSGDGKTVLTASVDGVARLWQVEAGQEWVGLVGHTGKVYSAAFSPDSQRIASGGRDNRVRLWSLVAGRPFVDAVRVQDAAVTSVAFSADGERLAIGLESGAVRVTSVGARVAPDVEINGPTGAVQTVAFSPDGSRVLSAGADSIARLWSAVSGQLVLELRGHGARVTSAAFSGDGRRIATSAEDGTARVWDAGSGQLVREVRGNDMPVRRVALLADGRQVVTAGDLGPVRFWDVEGGREVRTLPELMGNLLALNVSRDGRLVVAGSGRDVGVWDFTNGRRLAWLEGSTDVVQDVAFSGDGQAVAVASADGVVRLYRREMFAPLEELLALIPGRMVQ